MRTPFLPAAFATLALALALTGPASAASSPASCSGLAGSSRAGQPGAEAQVQQDVAAQAADLGITPGALKSEFSQSHLGTADACLN
jgi:membrane-bound lytic murein transglycosylase B